MNLLDGLNLEQKKAVMHTDGAVLILAGAGSGKTKALTHRMAYMIKEGRISPYNILAITFTNKASKEMKERLCSISEEGENVWVSTFHSACCRILRSDIDRLNYSSNFTIYDYDDSIRVVKSSLKILNMDEKLFIPKNILSSISKWKDELKKADVVIKETEGDFRNATIAKVYKEYEKILITNNALDFDDIILKCVELFQSNPDVLQKYQDKFKYIMVDEYQDTNYSQYKLINLLSEQHGNLCVVGDDDQSIYGWRGATISNILDFEKDYKNCTTIKLEQNYRSTGNILEVANAVIVNNSDRKDKKLWTEQEEGDKIKYFKAKSDFEEARFIVDKIIENQSNNISLKDNAILYRNNVQSRSMEDQLIKKSIPYRLIGGVKFYERKEIKDLLDYLKFINNQQDTLALLRIINTPKRGIGDTTILRISEHANKNEISFYSALNELVYSNSLNNKTKTIEAFKTIVEELIDFSKNNSISNLLDKIIETIGYIEILKIENTEESLERIENIKEFQAKIQEFENFSDNDTLSGFLEEISLIADVDSYESTEEYVTLMTLHSSKGLEFPYVFLCGFEENIFPSYRSISSGNLKDLEEERRLCYVGITRAKKVLYLTNASSRMQYNNMVYNPVSRFFKEIPEHLVENLSEDDISSRNSSFKSCKSAYNSNVSTNKYTTLGEKGRNYLNKNLEQPKDIVLDFVIGDYVKQNKYGIGKVLDIKSASADFEVTVEFEEYGTKKFMAKLSKLKKDSSLT